MSRPLFLLIKPVSWNCNLRCTYCFYLCKEKIYPQKAIRMEDEVLEKVLGDYFSSDQAIYNLCWQGGEPSLAGLDFYRNVIELEKKHARKGSVIANALQTNGTLLNDEWAEFLSYYHFLTGLSLDGPKGIHDSYRMGISGKGSWKKTMKGLESLRSRQADTSLLALINADNVKKPEEVYRFLRRYGTWLQFTPCVEFDSQGNLLPWAITGEQWGKFLCKIFDLWIQEDAGRIHIRHFDAVLEKLLGQKCSLCTMSESCANYLVVEHNGDIYPCDFYVDPAHKLGNVMNDSLMDLAESPKFESFGTQKRPRSAVCRACSYASLCQGDCPRNRTLMGTDDQRSVLCSGWQMFFQHSLPALKQMAMQITLARAGAIKRKENGPRRSGYRK